MRRSGGRYVADSITAVPAVWDPANALTSNAAADIAFMDPTRYAIAKSGVDAAVADNSSSYHALGTCQAAPGNSAMACVAELREAGTRHRRDAEQLRRQNALRRRHQEVRHLRPERDGTELIRSHRRPRGTVMVAPADNTAASVLTVVRRAIGDNTGPRACKLRQRRLRRSAVDECARRRKSGGHAGDHCGFCSEPRSAATRS